MNTNIDSAHFRCMADTIPGMAWLADPSGFAYFYNAWMIEYVGKSQEVLIGTPDAPGWPTVVHPDDLTHCTETWNESVRTGKQLKMTARIRKHTGEYHSFLCQSSAIRNDEGRITHWFGVNNDITDQMSVRQELEDANARKDEFLAMLAHELRNPLAPIKNAIQLMKVGVGSPIPAHFIRARDMIDRQVHHMTRLVDDLLDVSRITRGKINLKKEKVSLSEIIQNAIESNRPILMARNQHLQTQLPNNEVVVKGDTTRLAQIVANLLNNAAKYTPEGGHIWLTLDQVNGSARIIVKDSGIGIVHEMQDKIFSLFVQSERAIARSEGGLGIGLTVAKTLTELHKGTIEVHSDGAGMGSTFTVVLPVANDDMEAEPEENPNPFYGIEMDEDNADAPVGAKTVVVVDDNKDAADSLAMLMRTQGHRVYVSYDGNKGLEVIKVRKPDLVLLDLGLPGMSGLEVCKTLRYKDFPKMVVVALTGYGSDADRLKTSQAGFNYHLTKPLDYDQLNKIMKELQ